MNVIFQAHYVQTPKTPIRHIADGGKICQNISGHVVKLNVSSPGNMRVLNATANRYQKNIKDSINNRNYADSARNNFNRIYCNPSLRENEEFYVYTTEDVDKTAEFETMDIEQIVGVAQVNNSPESKICELKFFHVDPRTNYRAEKRKYTEVGESFLKGLENIVKKSVLVNPDYKAWGFYLKMGYEAYKSGMLIHEYKEEETTSPSE